MDKYILYTDNQHNKGPFKFSVNTSIIVLVGWEYLLLRLI